MTSLTATVGATVKATYTNTSLDVGSSNYQVNETFSTSFANGTASGQANVIWTDTRTINSSSNDDLDFAGSLTDAYGATLTFATIKAIIIKAAANNPNNLVLADDNSINIKPGGKFMLEAPATGFTVTASTGDKIRLTNPSTGAITYEIMVIGTK
jgi:hypothetical protein